MHRTLRPPRRRLLAALSALAVAVAVLPVVLAATAPPAAATGVPASTWTQLSPATSPSARYGAAMAFDPTTGQTLLFGGFDGTFLADTWTWNGTTWTQRSPATSPPARSAASMAFDEATGQMLLFGGFDGTGTPGTVLADTWAWNGTTWTQLSPATSPHDRFGAAMAFDPTTGQTVLFGGKSGSKVRGDTWLWDGTTWTEVSPTPSPPVRFDATMAFDPATGQMLLFSGTDDLTLRDDTWAWNGTNWTQLSPATSPPARWRAAMAFDPASGRMLLFSGYGSSNPLSDTWSWNGTTWTQQSPATSPPARWGAAMAFDASTGQMLLFGGRADGGAPLGDTWVWGRPPPVTYGWTLLSPGTAPAARDSASMTFDPSTGQMLLYGGDDGGGPRDETWNWTGTTWTQLAPSTSPAERCCAAMAFDPSTGDVVLFGGEDVGGFRDDTLIWDGNLWTQLSPVVSPSARYGPSMAYDESTGQMILFGGTSTGGVLGDTWIWEGTGAGGVVPGPATWTQLSPTTSPPARFLASMAFDPTTGQLLLFGGMLATYGPSAETWTWDGITWTQLSPATSPTARFGASMAFDPSSGRMVLFGGYDSGSDLSADTWTWDGTTWTQQSPATSPPARYAASMAYDESTGQMLLFGGTDASGINPRNDTWVWGPVSAAAPTVSAIVPSSGAAAGGTPVTVTGTGFVAGATVTIGGIACGSVNVTGPTSLTCVTGAHAAGVVDVVVTVSSQASTGGTGLFTYYVPSAPTGVTLTAGPGPGRGTVNATAPPGPTPTAYQTRCMPVGTPWTATAPPAAWIVWPTLPVWIDLTPGSEYRCKVRARSVGPGTEGPLSEWSNTVLILGAPNAPTGLTQSAPALPSGRNVTLDWSVTPGGAARPVTGQEAQCTSTTGGVTRTATLTPTARTTRLTALTQGASYTCAVRAVNDVGTSTWVTAPAFTVPQAAPRNVVASTPVARATRVTFTPATGGLAVTNYRATCTSTNGGTTRTGTATASPVTVSNLTAGKQYRCTITPRIGSTDGATSTPSNPITVP